MWYCKECDLEFEEPGTWNANAKKFLCANCLSPLLEQAVEQSVQSDVVSPAEEEENLAEMNKVANELLG